MSARRSPYLRFTVVECAVALFLIATVFESFTP